MKDIYPDGNAFAERQYNSANRQEPTEYELERFIEDWLEKRKKWGTEFISEALFESNLTALYQAWDGPRIELAKALKDTVEAYWRPLAEKEAAYHDFEEDRRPD